MRGREAELPTAHRTWGERQVHPPTARSTGAHSKIPKRGGEPSCRQKNPRRWRGTRQGVRELLRSSGSWSAGRRKSSPRGPYKTTRNSCLSARPASNLPARRPQASRRACDSPHNRRQMATKSGGTRSNLCYFWLRRKAKAHTAPGITVPRRAASAHPAGAPRATPGPATAAARPLAQRRPFRPTRYPQSTNTKASGRFNACSERAAKPI